MDEAGTVSLVDLQLAEPKSIRAFLCGQYYACKTTLCNSVMPKFMCFRFSIGGELVTLMNRVEKAVKIVGGLIMRTSMDEEAKISICNLRCSRVLCSSWSDVPEHMSKYFKLVLFTVYQIVRSVYLIFHVCYQNFILSLI